MTLTVPADLAACFDRFEYSAARLEVLRTYDVPAEAESLKAFELGLPLPERSVRTNPWLARIQRTTAAGKSWARTRRRRPAAHPVRAVPAQVRLPPVSQRG